jgi:hypothetical protein
LKLGIRTSHQYWELKVSDERGGAKHKILGVINVYIKQVPAASDKVHQLLAHGRWFSPGTRASSTTKTGRHDIAEILLKVALNTKNQINRSSKVPWLKQIIFLKHA